MSERLEQDLNPDRCDAAAVVWQLRYQANWELVIIRVYDKPVDSEYMCIFIYEISFELWMETIFIVNDLLL